MKKGNALKSDRKRFLLFSLFLVLCLPLIVWQIVNENFDLRNLAFEEVEVSEENPCVISFPNVNPYTLEVGKTVRVQVEGIAQGSGITSVLITDSTGEELFSKNYESTEIEIAETFEFTPTESKAYDIVGTLSEGSYSTACVISSPYDVKGVRAVASNSAPEFTSSPTDSEPSQDIDTGISYEYTLTATDPEGDFINYVFSFTPNNQWLKYTVINDGSDGNLKIQFKGSTTEPASYLANVFIHDGYSKHLRSQSWIISVNPAENDVPRVTVLSPWEALTLSQGDPLTIKWAATDNNAITHYELYLAQSLQDEDSWYTVTNDIAYNLEEYTIDTEDISAGTYKAIIKAYDNQTPSLVGRGVSALIEILGEEFDMPDDQVQIPEPQIINVSPTGEDDISNLLVTVRASLVASEGANIVEDSIVVKVDGIDVTSKVKFNKISESEYTVIYQTEDEYEAGLHKVEISFTDDQELEANKSWTFNITSETTDPDKFYFFGYGITKTIVYVVGGGILLLILALVIPLILVKVWKEDEETTEDDTALIPPQPINPVESMVNQTEAQSTATLPQEGLTFSKPGIPIIEEQPKEKAGGDIKKKIIEAKEKAAEKNSSSDTVPTTTVEENTIPEPDVDLQMLYSKINQANQEDTPPEPTI
ncbi:MAG: Ig-like domain-containing protein [Candidatus Dojkabacteria bacterium]|nr:Ig-like domain-containing protein [Candidatus Dojkabacteria bacterium]